MKIFDFATRLMSMSDKVWRRHANPWSVWTRIPLIFVMAPAAYSWKYLGWWAVLPLSLCFIWAYLNPRIFAPVKAIDTWASKAVFGEKIFTERKKKGHRIPLHHIQVANILTISASLFALLMILGIVLLDAWMTFAGTLGSWLSKMWFIDRMVWLYEDKKELLDLKEED